MTSVTIPLPDDLFGALRSSPGEVAAEMRLFAAIEWYRRGLISQGRAAEIAGVPRARFIDSLAERHVEVVQIDGEALDRELSVD